MAQYSILFPDLKAGSCTTTVEVCLLRFSLTRRVLVPEDNFQEVGEEVPAFFPYNVEIRQPEDKSQLLSWKNRLEDDMKMVQDVIVRVSMFAALALACHNKYVSYRSEQKHCGGHQHKSDTIDHIKDCGEQKEGIPPALIQGRSQGKKSVGASCS
ncbi:Ubiquitin-like domain-containing protein [Raphanus sativus]|nr:Ubiquitin-like domain-containing protein [Raphanus sativus]KAJ4873561.1 Ubiquitin-like domain-containing protein [Raphanus sativus]KAJ4873579.1 Ubiquitin-like domain-containing protein [Raphanus sativus]KAJ4873860.1 Ubiquitin-like domain-containing protein [Raphanus sativus]